MVLPKRVTFRTPCNTFASARVKDATPESVMLCKIAHTCKIKAGTTLCPNVAPGSYCSFSYSALELVQLPLSVRKHAGSSISE
jgi:hypothetical protein